MNKKRSGRNQAQFSVEVSGAINLMNAVREKNYSRHYSNMSGNLSGSIFSENENKKDAIIFSVGSRKNDSTSKYETEHQLYNSILLKKESIPPKSYLEGLIIIDGKDFYPKKYAIIFPVGIDQYKIILNPVVMN